MAIGGEAAAQVDPDPDGIGIYVGQAANVTAIAAVPGAPVEAYLVLARPSSPGAILGWERRLVVPDHVTIWGWSISGSKWFNYGSPPESTVCYVDGLPLANAILLMTFIIFVNDAEPAQFSITHTDMNSGGYDLPAYVDASNLKPHPAAASRSGRTGGAILRDQRDRAVRPGKLGRGQKPLPASAPRQRSGRPARAGRPGPCARRTPRELPSES